MVDIERGLNKFLYCQHVPILRWTPMSVFEFRDNILYMLEKYDAKAEHEVMDRAMILIREYMRTIPADPISQIHHIRKLSYAILSLGHRFIYE